MKKLFYLLLLVMLSINTYAQNHTCSGPPPNTATNTDPSQIVYGQSGNTYNIEDWGARDKSLELVEIDYFKILYFDASDEQIELMNDVFEYLTAHVNKRDISQNGGCSFDETIRVDVRLKDFANYPDVPSNVHAFSDALLDAGISGTQCGNQSKAVFRTKAFTKLNGGKPQYGLATGGAADIRITLDENYNWNTELITVFDGLDLYSVLLHEMVHGLGFASMPSNTFTNKITAFQARLNVENLNSNTNDLLFQNDDCSSICYTLEGFDYPSLALEINSNCEASSNYRFTYNDIIEIGGDFYGADNGQNATANKFSHINGNCNNGNEYLMKPILNDGEFFRSISDLEFTILCDLGYSINNNQNTSCEGCFTLAHRDLPFSEIELGEADCCINTFYTPCYQTGSIDIPKSAILCNDISSDNSNLEVLFVQELGSNAELTITEVGDMYHVVSPTPGEFSIAYAIGIPNCDCKISTATVSIVFDQACEDCPDELPPCEYAIKGSNEDNENINDFENYERQNKVYFGLPFGFEGESGYPSSIVLAGIAVEPNNGNHYLDLTKPCGDYQQGAATFTLCESIPDGKKYKINLRHSGSSIAIWGSENAPCNYGDLILPKDCNIASDCDMNGTVDYQPHCISGNGLSIPYDYPGTDIYNPLWSDHTFEFTNNSGHDINYITFIDNNFIPGVCDATFARYLDDIVIEKVNLLDASFEALTSCFNANFTFTGENNTGTFTHTWDFGDGSQSTDENPTHTYLEEGVFLVVHTITNDCGEEIIYKEEITITCSTTNSCTICSPQSIGDNQTWTTTQPIVETGTVVKEPGQTLTIAAGVEVRFCQDASLIIKKGGTLNLYGTLTSCDTYWQGVRVLGDSSNPYQTDGFNDDKGKFHVYDDAIVENAVIGAELTGGAIIRAYAGTFINNQVSVWIKQFTNLSPFIPNTSLDYNSSFKETNFLINDDFPDYNNASNWDFSNVVLVAIKGITFRGCNFLNTKDAVDLMHSQFGILAVNSGLNVTYMCQDANPSPNGCDNFIDGRSHFLGIQYAISIINISDLELRTNVNQTLFEHCLYGISNHYNNYGRFINNEFIFSDVDILYKYGVKHQFGIALHGDQVGFVVEENNFTGVENVNVAIGIYADNIGADNNYIRKNTFTNSGIGNLAYGINNNIPGDEGLIYTCNENYGTQGNDFIVYPNALSLVGGINEIQGNVIPIPFGTAIAEIGNTFCNSTTNPTAFHYDNKALPYPFIKYYTETVPPSYHGVVIYSPQDDNTCPENYPDPSNQSPEVFELEATIEEFEGYKSTWEEYRDFIKIKLEGESVISEISQASTGQNIMASVVDRSPYLSANEFIEMIDKPSIFNNAALIDIILQNPGVLNNTIIELLKDKVNPFSNEEIQGLLEDSTTATSERTEIESLIYANRQMMDKASNKIIRYLKDQENVDQVEIMKWFDMKESKVLDYTNAKKILQDGNMANMMDILAEMPTKYNMTANEVIDHSITTYLLVEVKNNLDNGHLITALPEETLDLLTAFEEGESYHNRFADNLLRINELRFDLNPIIPIDTKDPKEVKLRSGSNKSDNTLIGDFRLTPNPARDYILLEYNSIPIDEYVSIEIFGLSGQSELVQQLTNEKSTYISIENLTSGIYLYKIMSNDKTIKVGKFIVNK